MAQDRGGVFLSEQGGRGGTFKKFGLDGEDVRRLELQQEGVRTRLWGRVSAASPKPALRPAPDAGREPLAEARATARDVYWPELGDVHATAIFWGERLRSGNVVAGPAIIQVPDTTIVVHPEQTARVDPYGNLLIDLHGDA